jgi:soluble lytic murein transglycosylase-like protein
MGYFLPLVAIAIVSAMPARTGPLGVRTVVQREVDRIAAEEGVDRRLVQAVAEVESAYNPWAVSERGAVGVMQLMPGTAQMVGVREIRDVRQNIKGGVRYLRYLVAMFGGDLRLVAAAYNAGPGAVIRFGGMPPYVETQAYVRGVIARYYGLASVRDIGTSQWHRRNDRNGRPATCGGSEIAYDMGGRLYIRAAGRKQGCREAPER